ncbi:hypothetical protein PSHT_09415 [Puccinia striiformis]|uniref:Secreted protein n=1 Tax=Puccinia striiformis TaxID=27350 RepID=A0A2S4VHI3_9BASI|nr:hypothetical protein PSHT_09415 [Puccinia striiformis]
MCFKNLRISVSILAVALLPVGSGVGMVPRHRCKLLPLDISLVWLQPHLTNKLMLIPHLFPILDSPAYALVRLHLPRPNNDNAVFLPRSEHRMKLAVLRKRKLIFVCAPVPYPTNPNIPRNQPARIIRNDFPGCLFIGITLFIEACADSKPSSIASSGYDS